MSLHEVTEEILDRRGLTPKKLDSEFTGLGHRVVSAKLIKNGVIELAADEPRYVDEETYRRWMSSPLQADDVILTSEAPLGETAYINETLEWCLGQRLFGIRTNKNWLLGRFLYYALRHAPVRNDLLSRATGTTAQGIRQSELRRVMVPVPPLSEQRAIAHILGTLDDKIELNRQMNQTLDEIARTLFTSWFVNFDPVRAKAEGRQPEGMDAETAVLFPDRLVDSELGPIPEGWEVIALEEIAQFNRSTINPQESPESLFAHYSIPAFDSGQIPELTEGSKIKSNKYRVPPNAVLLSKLNPRIPRIWLPFYTNGEAVGSIASTKFFVLTATDQVMKPFITALIGESGFLTRFSALATGTSNSHQRVRPSDAQQMRIVLPIRALIETFAKRVDPVYELLVSNRAESTTLAELRDTLLPELISGRKRASLAAEV